jgi:hypothetical protein
MREVGLVVIVKNWLQDLWSMNGRRSLCSRKSCFALRTVVVIVIMKSGSGAAGARAEEAQAADSKAKLADKDSVVGRCRG